MDTADAPLRIAKSAKGFAKRFLNLAKRRGIVIRGIQPSRSGYSIPELPPDSNDDFLSAVEIPPGAAFGLRDDPIIRTSIIIPVFNKAEFTLECLRSLLREVDFSDTEVIVVDNASTDETPRVLSCFKDGIRVITNTENRGFVEALNQGSELGRGEYLVFLNNDTVVLPGWLSALTESVSHDESIGAVGSMFLYPDGRLQEAGSIVWRDGKAHHYGRGRSPNDRRFNFAREVDFCSAASLLIRKELFARLGGFDKRFSPACYEDVDLCFGVRSLGKRVVYQPASRLIHFEGGTAGQETTTGLKRFQIINREKFVDKWREVLQRDHLENRTENITSASNRNRGPRILVFDDHFPVPDRDAGSTRMFLMLKMLTLRGRPVLISTGKPQPELEQILWKEGIETGLAVDYVLLPKGSDFSAAVLSRPEVARAMLKTVRRANPKAPVIFDMVDAHFVRLGRESEVSGDENLRKESNRYAKLESRLARAVDQLWCASSEDKKAMSKFVSNGKIVVVPTIHPLHERGRSFTERSGLLFVGSFAHRPNGDAVLYFLREVFPIVQQDLPDITLDIVGSATPEIAAYESTHVRVRGYVPDVAPYFQNSRVFVAPLRFGAGMKGKIGDALSYGLPVVTTSIGAESTGLRHENDVMIADDPESFAAAVREVYSDEGVWDQLAENGYRHIDKNFSPEVIQKLIFEALNRLNVSI